MSDISGVASVEAGATPTPVAPTELGTIESSSEGTASSTAQTDGQQLSPNELIESFNKKPETSAGIKNLRTHADTLKKDLDRYRQDADKYRPVYEEVDKYGGIETVKGLVGFHNNFTGVDPETFRSEGVYQTLGSLYDSNPANYTVLVETIAEQHPDIVKAALAKSDPEYKQLLGLKEQYGQQEEGLIVPDDELDPENPLHKELLEYRQEKAERLAQQQKQQKQAHSNIEQEQQQRMAQVNTGMFGEAHKQLTDIVASLKLDEEAIAKLEYEFEVRIRTNRDLMEDLAGLYRTTEVGGKPPLGVEKRVKQGINQAMADVINQHTMSQRSARQPQEPQQKQPTRVHVNSNTSLLGMPKPEDIDLDNEEQRRSVLNTVMKSFNSRVK